MIRSVCVVGAGAIGSLFAAHLSRVANVLVLTTYDRDEDIFRSLRAGAKAYMLKDAAGHAKDAMHR